MDDHDRYKQYLLRLRAICESRVAQANRDGAAEVCLPINDVRELLNSWKPPSNELPNYKKWYRDSVIEAMRELRDNLLGRPTYPRSEVERTEFEAALAEMKGMMKGEPGRTTDIEDACERVKLKGYKDVLDYVTEFGTALLSEAKDISGRPMFSKVSGTTVKRLIESNKPPGQKKGPDK